MQQSLDVAITAVLQPTIIRDLGHISLFPFIGATYAICNAALILLWGKLFMTFDSKSIFLIARLFFAIGSAVSAAAPSMKVFIVGRAITGIGGGGTYLGVVIIITALTTLEEKGRYFGYIGFAWGIGTILGPLIGGAFAASTAGWRWSYYFDLILVAMTLPIFVFMLRSTKTSYQRGFWDRIHALDLTGCALFTCAFMSGMLAILFGGATFSWKSGPVIGLFGCLSILGVLFLLQQATATLTTRQDRVLPLHLLCSIDIWILIAQVTCPGETAFRSAISILPFLVPCVTAMLVSGILIGIFKYYKIWFACGSVFQVLMAICLYNTDVGTGHGKIYGYLIVGGVGAGLVVMNSGPIMSATVPKQDIKLAGTLFGYVDMISGAVSVGIANSIFLNRATARIQHLLPNAGKSIVQNAITGAGGSTATTLPPATKPLILRAIMESIKDIWVQLIATASLALVLSLFMKKQKLKQIASS
ncbi:MAG: hypothetical protein M1820_008203 [Bogoriella megaspora]|nr:MAG: hypothetical protein M1820_008203 [Bogoriella megaspora]